MNTAKPAPVFATVVLGILLAAGPARAQSVITPTSPVATEQLNESLTAAGITPDASTGATPLNWGMVAVRPHLLYRYLYGDGILAGPGRETKTTIHSISPGVLFELGSRWSLDYTATQTYYSEDAFRDRLDHSARLNGSTGYFGNLGLSFSHRYSDSSSLLAETAAQTRVRTHTTALNASYSLGSRTGLSSSVRHTLRSATTIPGYREWSFVEGFQYQVSPRIKTSLNAGFGTVDVRGGTDMTYFRPSAQVSIQATEKLSLGLQAGRERRKFRNSDAPSMSRPTYSGSLAYRPFETTTVVLSASRSTSVSYFQSLVTDNTGWNLTLRQRLLQRFFFSARYSQRETTYVATRLGLDASRKDDRDTLSFRLSTRLFERMTVGVSYQESDHDSNVSAFSYSSSQFGAEVGYRF